MEQIQLNHALRTAIKNNNLDGVKEAIRMGADVNFRDDGLGSSFTPLMLAANHGADTSDICQVLIDHGADVLQTTAAGSTLLDVAAERVHRDTAKFLMRHGAVPNIESERIMRFFRAMQSEPDYELDRQKQFPPSQRRYTLMDRTAPWVLDACATGQFVSHVARPLLESNTPQDRKVFKEIWDRLPEIWKIKNASLYVQFLKRAPISPGDPSARGKS